MERELIEFQSRMADPEMEKKLRKQVKKYKALLEDAQSELERLKDSRGNSAIVKSLRNQLEDLQASETSANKAQKRLQAEMDEMIIQNDELSRSKIEVLLHVYVHVHIILHINSTALSILLIFNTH